MDITGWIYFLIEDDDLLGKYNTIWDNVSPDIKKEFDNELVTIKKYLKTKIKSHGDEVTDFSEKEILKVDYSDTSLAAISWDFVLELLSACVFKLM